MKNIFVLEETNQIEKIRFESKNFYWFNKDLNMVYSLQKPMPNFTL